MFVARQLGLDLNAHAFRHLAAKLFLRAQSGEYAIEQLPLGQKSLVITPRAHLMTNPAVLPP